MIWYCLEVRSGMEKQIAADISPSIFAQAWYPVRDAYRRSPGKPPVAYRVPAVSGYVLAQTRDAAPWHLLRVVRGYIRAVGGVNPRIITQREIERMAQMPSELQAIIDAEREAAVIRVGDIATIINGTLQGRSVKVSAFKGDCAIIDAGLLGRVTVPVTHLQKDLTATL